MWLIMIFCRDCDTVTVIMTVTVTSWFNGPGGAHASYHGLTSGEADAGCTTPSCTIIFTLKLHLHAELHTQCNYPCMSGQDRNCHRIVYYWKSAQQPIMSWRLPQCKTTAWKRNNALKTAAAPSKDNCLKKKQCTLSESFSPCGAHRNFVVSQDTWVNK